MVVSMCVCRVCCNIGGVGPLYFFIQVSTINHSEKNVERTLLNGYKVYVTVIHVMK
jgi:hypothetical protein